MFCVGVFSTPSYILVHGDGLSSGQLTQSKFFTPFAHVFGPCSCGPKQANQTSLFFFPLKTWVEKKSFLPIVRELWRCEPGNCKEPSKGENEVASRDTQRHRVLLAFKSPSWPLSPSHWLFGYINHYLPVLLKLVPDVFLPCDTRVHPIAGPGIAGPSGVLSGKDTKINRKAARSSKGDTHKVKCFSKWGSWWCCSWRGLIVLTPS